MATAEVTPEGRTAPEVLAWSCGLLDPALRAAVDTLPDPTRHVAGYHFGWWDQQGNAVETTGGKALRPALVLLSAEAVGGNSADALPAAVAVELVHNFSLLHDDVMDSDHTRRHRPTAWSVFGVSAAILAGDALLTLASGVLAESGSPVALPGARMLNATVQQLVHGQVMDLSFEQRTDVDLAECLDMARAKTGSLLGCACALGSTFGGGGSERVEQLRLFGSQLGLAFQHVDDLLGIWGDPATTGKPVYSDLRSRKKSLPVAAALESGGPAGMELDELYRREEPLSEDDLGRAAQLVHHAGGRSWSEKQADARLSQAVHELHAAGPVPEPAMELVALARLATHRDH